MHLGDKQFFLDGPMPDGLTGESFLELLVALLSQKSEVEMVPEMGGMFREVAYFVPEKGLNFLRQPALPWMAR